jgi:hypothetical protein
MEQVLIPAFVSAIVALIISFLSPRFTHTMWKRQKRKEQQVAVAERYAVLLTQLIASDNLTFLRDRSVAEALRLTPTEIEFRGMLFVIQVLFESDNIKRRAREVAEGGETAVRMRAELMAYLLAEALDLPFDKIPKLGG